MEEATTCTDCDPNNESNKHICLSDSDDFPSDSNVWEDKIIILKPNEPYEKPPGHSLYLSQVSISPPHGSSGMKGVLRALVGNGDLVLSVLTNERPIQITNLAWNSLQDVVLFNDGNRDITLSVMIQH